jgi:glycosyltransferase involved in cell wall biosynthesis
MKIILSHPTGNEFVRNALLALYQEGGLLRFYTAIGWSRDNLLTKLAPTGLRKRLSRRSYPIPAKFIRNSPVREFFRLARPFGAGAVTIDDVSLDLDRRVAADLPRLKSRLGATGVFAYEDGALSTLKAARLLGLDRIYELPIGYWRAGHRIFNEEKERKPEWESTLTGLKDSPSKLSRKDEELANADTVICASSFTKSTLELYPGNSPNIEVIPYGAPRPIGFNEVRVERSKRLRLLFVGGLSQRKGLSYLFDSVEALGDAVELTVIGQFVSEPPKVLEAHLRKCRYIASLSHGDILRQMREHDLFVFPSLFEGFGLVLLEAMSQGLPCITTSHTAGPDIIGHGQDGFIVPIRDTAAIVACVRKVLADPALLIAMKEAALAKAGELNWEKYQTRLAGLLRSRCR